MQFKISAVLTLKYCFPLMNKLSCAVDFKSALFMPLFALAMQISVMLNVSDHERQKQNRIKDMHSI